MRTARSMTSGEYLGCFFMTPFSQTMEPLQNPGRFIPGVESALHRVLDAAYRELPTSVVDQCRNAATVLVSRWMQVETGASAPEEKDLGAWIRTIKSHFGEGEMVALRAALEAINRLHPRGKDNEANRYQLRAVVESNAEFTVHALGFIIRDIGWAK
jgi:hypothetical protein